METLRRNFPTSVRAVSGQDFTAEFIITSSAVDSYGEIVIPSGVDFAQFMRNPVVPDSHDYSSVGNQIGTATKIFLQGGKLVALIRFAADVEGNDLAKLAWNMVQAGHLRACSIGFMPVATLTPSDGSDFSDMLDDLEVEDGVSVRRIYTKTTLMEVSIVLLPANPDALITDGIRKAYQAGAISERLLSQRPELSRIIKSSPSSMSTKTFLSQFRRSTSQCDKSPSGDPLSAPPRLPEARLESFGTPALSLTQAVDQKLRDPVRRQAWGALFRHLAQDVKARAADPIAKAWNFSSGNIGGILVPPQMFGDVWDLLLEYGAFRTLGLRAMPSGFTKYAKTTALPSAVWIVPSAGVTTIPQDGAFTGTSIIPEASTVAGLMDCSYQLLEDGKVDVATVILESFIKALSAAIDYACFQGNGVGDATNGGVTGIFVDANIATVVAAAGGISVATLARADFMNTVAAVAPASLQRPCFWWVNPSFLPSLAVLTDGSSGQYLLLGPDRTNGQGWFLCGFPVVWTAQAPAVNTAGSKIAAFGTPDAFLVALREEVAVDASRYSRFNSLNYQFRAYARCFAETREATGLATLTLAAR